MSFPFPPSPLFPTKLDPALVATISVEHPGLREDYRRLLENAGSGLVAEEGLYIYSGPYLPEDLFSDPSGIEDLLFIAQTEEGHFLAIADSGKAGLYWVTEEKNRELAADDYLQRFMS